MTVSFELDGEKFVALNGAPDFTFNEAISFQVSCTNPGRGRRVLEQALGGGEEGPCGSLKDKYGVSWLSARTLGRTGHGESQRVMRAMLSMKKIDIDALERTAASA